MKPIPIFAADKNYETRFKAYRPRKPEFHLDTVFARQQLVQRAIRMCCNFVVEPKVGVDNRQFSWSQRTDQE
jgi:hypothetical protein